MFVLLLCWRVRSVYSDYIKLENKNDITRFLVINFLLDVLPCKRFWFAFKEKKRRNLMSWMNCFVTGKVSGLGITVREGEWASRNHSGNGKLAIECVCCSNRFNRSRGPWMLQWQQSSGGRKKKIKTKDATNNQFYSALSGFGTTRMREI